MLAPNHLVLPVSARLFAPCQLLKASSFYDAEILVKSLKMPAKKLISIEFEIASAFLFKM